MASRIAFAASGSPATIHPARSDENPNALVVELQLMQLGAIEHAGRTFASRPTEKAKSKYTSSTNTTAPTREASSATALIASASVATPLGL